MGISHEEQIRRLKIEKASVGNTAKWMAISSFIYFVLMVFYAPEIGVLALSGGTTIVSSYIWFKKYRLIQVYKKHLAQLTESDEEK